MTRRHFLQLADTGGTPLTLDNYLRAVAGCKKLRLIEEAALAAQIAAGDEAALVSLVSANLRYVVSVAKRYADGRLALDQLIDVGNIGLMRAALLWSGSNPDRFISFALWRIRRTILLGLDGRLHSSFGLTSSAGLSDPKWWSALRADAQLRVHDERTPISIDALMENLEPLLVVAYRHALGLPTDSVATFEELGRQLGWTPEKIRKVKEELIRRLRNEFE